MTKKRMRCSHAKGGNRGISSEPIGELRRCRGLYLYELVLS